MATTKAGQKAVNKYIKNHYTRIAYAVPREFGEQIKAAAASAGLPVNTYISNAVKAYMEHENRK